MKKINFKKWLLGGSITGALVLSVIGGFTYDSISEFFYPSKKVITAGDEETHQGISRIEELLLSQGKASEEINDLLKQLLGDDYKAKLENEIIYDSLVKKLEDETLEQVLQEKEEFTKEINEKIKANEEIFRIEYIEELSISELNLLTKNNSEAMLARLKDEDKEVIEAISQKHSYSSRVIDTLVNAGYAKEVIEEVIDVADLRELSISELNLLTKNSPETMLARLKDESKIVIEAISQRHHGSYRIIDTLANAGYAKEVIADVIDVADLRELSISELNSLSEKSPEAMLARLKNENDLVIEAISEGRHGSYNIIHNLADNGYAKKVIAEVIDVADLRRLSISELNSLSEKSPEAMLARLKNENDLVIEAISEGRHGSYNIIHNLADAGYSKEVIEEVIDVADLRKLSISELNSLSKKSPASMLARLKSENDLVIEYLRDKTKVLEYVGW